MSPEKRIVTVIGLSKIKEEELSLKLKTSEFTMVVKNNIDELEPEEGKYNESFIISGEDLNLDLFKENLKKAEKLEKKVIALMPLNDMDLLITNFSRPFFDFCLPPHDVNEIFLRLINITGKSGNENKQLIISGPLIIDQESYEVTLDGEKVDLTFKEYELLRYLAAKPGRVFSRESLLHSVWEYDYYGGTRTVDVHVRRLRSKINDIRYNFIETVWNVGYRFKSVKAKNI
ncbi:MAG: winged helix-turn-helix domain-containing protein [Chloroflexota bacterium]|nr:winged helix-turn-helix domain-containing protein [Chloroflexota bacterium]MEC9450837.1 winged helix-turn-helix domain-containing protein [Chloroflexota bacterium]